MNFSFDDIIDQVTLRMIDVINQRPTLRPGLVTSYDPATNCVKVQWQPDGTLSGWLPVASHAASNGWGIWSPPNMGDEVIVEHLQGDHNSGIVIGTKHNTKTPMGSAPNTIAGSNQVPQQGEIVLVNKNGATIRLASDGSIYIKAININIDGILTVSGNIIGQQDVSDKHGSLERLRANYDGHQHSGVSTGNGLTGTTSLNDQI
jgi:phage baseplate assembly protein V